MCRTAAYRQGAAARGDGAVVVPKPKRVHGRVPSTLKHFACAQVRREGEEQPRALHPVAALLSYLTKAPLVPDGTPVVNALGRQRAMLENVVRACIGLPPDNNMMLEFK